MSNQTNITEALEHVDIYLIDQILKGRYSPKALILDAGCGSGRNLKWFYNNSYSFYAVDQDAERLAIAKTQYPLKKEKFSISPIENLPFESEKFHHIICSAVLHFAKNTAHFETMFAELVRVLKPKGSLFIRMTSLIGIEKRVKSLSNGLYVLPDETTRFLLTREVLKKQMSIHKLTFLEPLKTVIVDDVRAMSTLVLSKV